MNKISKKEQSKLLQLVIGVIIIITLLCYYAFNSQQVYDKKLDKKPQDIFQFLGFNLDFENTTIMWKGILLGMSSGIVFGFIDNAGLWFGMDALEPFLNQIPGIGDLTKAGLGNTFSDAIGAFAGTFAGIIIKNQIVDPKNPDKIPQFIWAEAIGIIIGCLLGIIIPRMITGKK
jgi:hypothetical protein